MFHRFFRCIFLSLALLTITSVAWAQDCPDTQPVITGADIACDQNAALVTYTYSTPATTGTPTHSYQWVVTPATGRTIVGPTNQNQLQVKWQSTGSYTVQVTEWNNDPTFAGCVGKVATKTITVQPLLHAYFYYQFDPAGGCFYNVVNFTGDVSVHADPSISYSWNFGDASPIVSGPAVGVLQHTFPPTSGVTYTVTLTVTNSAGQTDQIIDYVYVNPDQYKPVATFTNTPAPIPNNCLYNPMSFDGSASLAKPATNPENISILYYEWDFDDIGSGSSNQVNSGTTPTVNHIFKDFGLHHVKLTVTNSKYCTASYTKDIIIDNTIPTASFTNTLACLGEATVFTTTSVTPVGTFTQLEWIFGDGTSYTSSNPAEVISHTYLSLGTYSAKLRVTNSNTCISDYFVKPVSVNPSPMASFLVGNACLGEAVAFTNTSTLNGGSQISSFLWTFADPLSGSNTSNVTNPTHLFSAVGTYAVSLKATNSDGCANTYTMSPPLTVSPKPAVDFTFVNGTQNWEIQFHNITGATVGNNLVWDYGDGTFGYGPNPSHVYQGPGNFLVTLTATDAINGCSNSIQKQVTILGNASAFFTADSPKCIGDTMHFTPQIPGGNIVQEVWDFGDGVITTYSPPVSVFPVFATHQYTSSGTFTVTRTVTYITNFYESFSIQVVVFPKPTANFTYSNNSTFPNTYACANQAVYFTDLSFSGSGNVTQWLWDFDDPLSGINNTSVLQNPSHTFMLTGHLYHVSLTVTDNVNYCTHTLVKNVYVNPPVPVDYTFTNNTCLNQVVTFNANLGVMIPGTIATWDWDFGDGTTHVTSPLSAAHLYAAAGSYSAILTVTDTNGCSNSVLKTVTVMPKPVSGFTYASPTCDSLAVQFTDQSYVPAGFPGFINEWVWTWGDGTTDTVSLPSSPNLSHVFPGGVYNFTVKLMVISSFGCRDSITHPVHVIPAPTAAFEVLPGTPSCATQVVQFHDLSQTNGGGSIVAWLWNFSDPGSGINNTSTSPNPSHTFILDGTYSVKLIVTNANGCSHSVTIPVVIHKLPVANFIADSACAGGTTHFTDTSIPWASAITSYSWTFGDGGISSLQSPLHTYATFGIYNATLTIVNVNGCSSTVTKQVTVHPNPVPAFTFSAASCIGNPVTFTDLSFIPSGFAGYIKTWIWNFGDGSVTPPINYPASPNISHTFLGVSTSHVVWLTVITTNNCIDSISKLVNSIPSPLANFTHSNTTCLGQTVQFTDLSQTNGGGSIQNWNWNFGDPLSGGNNISTQQNPTHSFTAAGNFPVNLVITSTNGCTNTFLDTIRIDSLPAANFTYASACESNPTMFTSTSIANGGSIISYTWNFGDGGTSNMQNPPHTYGAYGNYVVTLTVVNTNGCIHTVNKPVIVNPKPIADFSFSPASCVGNPVSFFDQSFVPTGFSSYIQTWQWDFGDGSVTPPITFPSGPNMTHVFLGNASTHIVRLTVTTTTGCINFIEKTVTSVPAPIANFSYSTVRCANQPVQFTDLSQTNGGGSIQTWSWNFGDPASGINNISNVQNPTHSFSTASPPSFNITLIVTNGNGCKDTLLPLPQVTVNVRPVSNFTADTVCKGSLTTFADQSTPAGSVASYLWDFGDGQTGTGAGPTHLYATTGNFNVKLTVTSNQGCVKDTTKAILVLGKPISSFSYSSPNCAGDSVQFTDLSSTPHGSISQWTWDFGDGTVVGPILFPNNQNIKHKYTNGGTYNVKLTILTTDGCTAEKITAVQIGFRPLANFSFGTNACALSLLQFTDLSQTNGGPSLTTWAWNFGDPGSGADNTSTTQNPTHAFSTGGPHIVRLMVTNANGCSDSLVGGKTVNVNAAPVAIFTADTACMASPTQFTDASTTAAGTIVSWAWNFGDPASGINNTSTIQDPAHIYITQGTYTVTLQVTNSSQCLKDTTMQIVVNPKPMAMFQYTASCVNTGTVFTDMSTAAGSSIKSWSWNFGDGSPLVTIQNPTHIYTAAGTYQVHLTVTNLANCVDSVTIPVISRPTPVAAFTQLGFYCPQGKVDFQDISTATGSTIAQREWIFEPGYTSNIPNPSHTFPVTDTTYLVTLIVTDTYGCMDTIIDSVYVKPGFAFTFNNDTVCQGYTTHFTPVNKALGDTLYSVTWNFGDPASGPSNISQLYNPVHVFSGAATYVVKMKAYNSDNCVDSVYHDVRVYAAPKPLYSFLSTPCDSTIYFNDSTVNSGGGTITSWHWIFGDGSPDVIISAPGPGDTSHLYVNAGIYPVTLVMTNSHGCVDSITRSVQRFPCIKAGFTFKDTLCARYKIAFSDSSLPVTRINQWHWTWGDGTDTTYTAHHTPITHTYADSGSYSVNLEIQALVNGTNIIDNLISTVKVRPTPITYFSNVPVCLNQLSLFRDTSKTFGLGVSKWNWTFGSKTTDTSTLKNPPHRYDTAGIYNVKLIVTNRYGCKDSLTKPTRIYGLPTAHYDNTSACTGDPTFFTDKSVKSDTTFGFWRWYFGDPTSMKDSSNVRDPNYRYPNTGDYSVRMIVKDHYGCIDTVDSTVKVNITPVSSFTIVDGYNGKQGQVKVNNVSTGAESYTWDFGNGKGSTEQNPVALFTEDGTYTIKLISLNQFDCSDTTYYKYELLFKGLYVPNAFAPASTNLGIRLFQPVGVNLKQYHVTVFDMWGHLLWESTKLDDKGMPTEGWDGTFEGAAMPQGNYMWRISASFVDNSPWEGSDIGTGDSKKTMGSVTLVK